MTRRARLARAVAALGLVLVGPALLVIPTHRAAERTARRTPPVERSLSAILESLDRPFACASGTVEPSGPLTEDRLWADHRALTGANHALALDAFDAEDWQVFRAMAWRLPGTRGLADVHAGWAGLAETTAEFEVSHPLCRWADRLDARELRDEERRSAAEVAAYRARLAPFVQRLGAARAALERDRPVLAATAWSLGIIEVVGGTLLLLVLRQEYRTWSARREAGSRPQA